MFDWLDKLDKDQPCQLCEANSPRVESHIIPKFVFKHAAIRSPTKFLRTTEKPNLRVQDGLREYLLCEACEGLFSKWEDSFARTYRAHYEEPGRNFFYRREDALAALSILWRVAAHAISHPEHRHLELGNDYSRLHDGANAWRDVLLGKIPHPGKFRAFWVFMNYAQGRERAEQGFNRHVFHSIDFDILASSKRLFILVHLPGVYLIGALEETPRAAFKGIDISFKGGRYLSTENKVLPEFVLENIENSIDKKNASFANLSSRQQSKILTSLYEDPERALASPLFRTHQHDQDQKKN